MVELEGVTSWVLRSMRGLRARLFGKRKRTSSHPILLVGVCLCLSVSGVCLLSTNPTALWGLCTAPGIAVDMPNPTAFWGPRIAHSEVGQVYVYVYISICVCIYLVLRFCACVRALRAAAVHP